VLRAGIGTSKGELLELAEDTTGIIQWRGRVFPRSTEGDKDGPEALPAISGILPHLHVDWQERFPVAMACEEIENEDPEENNSLEERGVAIGTGLGRPYGEPPSSHLLATSQRVASVHAPVQRALDAEAAIPSQGVLAASSAASSSVESSRRSSASRKITFSVDTKDSRT
jgi:hypothetical protein